MKLWRLVRPGYEALDGAGAREHGGRYTPPGAAVVPFASEPGLAVLVAMRYLDGDPRLAAEPFLLGWTELDAAPERAPDDDSEDAVRAAVAQWLETCTSPLMAVRSRVLPEADVILMNPRHPLGAAVPPLVTRSFSFAECLHVPPMRDRYRAGQPRGAASS